MSSEKLIVRIKIVWIVRVLLLLPLLWYFYCFIPTGDGSKIKEISIPQGSGIKKLSLELKQNRLIRSSIHFSLMTRLRGETRTLKSGEYRLNDGMTPTQILTKIVSGEVDLRRFTLPEGYSMYQGAELSEQKKIFSREQFLVACRNIEIMKKFGIEGDSLEGYLFPATYTVGKTETAEQLVTKMVEQFFKNYSEIKYLQYGSDLPLHHIVTLASMVEKEAVASSEKPFISSVFYNRLKIGMPLQSDPTAVYGVRAFSGKITKKDIERPSKYNTYIIKGLPPGPIGNPGLDAIKSVLQPEKTSYLYFVARQDRTHQFSKNLEEHNTAVRRFLK